MPDRLFLDANVLFTASISRRGVGHTLFELAPVDACQLLTSAFALDEARRNLRAKYATSLDELGSLSDRLELVPEGDLALVTWAADVLPPKDAPILAAAVAAGADLLVTGDRRHFGALYGKVLRGVIVLPPREALERLLSGPER